MTVTVDRNPMAPEERRREGITSMAEIRAQGDGLTVLLELTEYRPELCASYRGTLPYVWLRMTADTCELLEGESHGQNGDASFYLRAPHALDVLIERLQELRDHPATRAVLSALDSEEDENAPTHG